MIVFAEVAAYEWSMSWTERTQEPLAVGKQQLVRELRSRGHYPLPESCQVVAVVVVALLVEIGEPTEIVAGLSFAANSSQALEWMLQTTYYCLNCYFHLLFSTFVSNALWRVVFSRPTSQTFSNTRHTRRFFSCVCPNVSREVVGP